MIKNKKINKTVFNLDKLKNLNKELIFVYVYLTKIFIVYDYLKSKGFKNVLHFYKFSEKLRKNFYLSNGWYVNKNAKVGKFIKFCRNFLMITCQLVLYKFLIAYSKNTLKILNHIDIYLNSITKRFS